MSDRVAALLAVLEGREHWPRVEAIEALGALGATAAVPALREVLEDDAFECWHTRTAALRALAALEARDAAVVDAMVVALRFGDDPDVRLEAARALGTLRVEDAAVALRRTAALSGTDAELAAACREALEKLGAG